MEIAKGTFTQACQIMEQHEVESVFVNEGGHFFLSENPALLSVGYKKEKVLKLDKKTAEAGKRLEEMSEEIKAAQAKDTPAEPAKTPETPAEDTPAAFEQPELFLAADEAEVAKSIDVLMNGEAVPTVPVQLTLTTGNPESPEERGELVVKAEPAKSSRKKADSKEKGA